jgi:hypothetical protein
MKRIGVVIVQEHDLETCLQRLAEAQVPVVHAQLEQQDYVSFYVEDQYMDAALVALRRGGFDAALV